MKRFVCGCYQSFELKSWIVVKRSLKLPNWRTPFGRMFYLHIRSSKSDVCRDAARAMWCSTSLISGASQTAHAVAVSQLVRSRALFRRGQLRSSLLPDRDTKLHKRHDTSCLSGFRLVKSHHQPHGLVSPMGHSRKGPTKLGVKVITGEDWTAHPAGPTFALQTRSLGGQ